MSAETRARLFKFVSPAVAQVGPASGVDLTFERPRDPSHGDYATTVALQLSKTLKRPPRKIAEEIVAALPASDLTEAPEIAGPGFINFRLKPAAKQAIVRAVLEAGSAYGRTDRGHERSVMVEFVSANPTGPLHVGHGRQAALGDAIASLLESQGYRVTREFYYNDAGAQIENLALSVQRPRAARTWASREPSPRTATTASTSARSPTTTSPRSVTTVGDDLGRIRQFAVAELRRRAGRGPPRVRGEASTTTTSRVLALHRRPRGRDGRSASSARARPTSTTARCGCARPTTATTRTA